MRAIKKNMKDQILTGDKKILHCVQCGAEFSGNVGDYFMAPDNHVFHCPYDDTEMELVNKVVTIAYL
jgi:hypothetical protein